MNGLTLKRGLLCLALALALALGSVQARDAKADGGRLIWGMPAAETVLDPHIGCGALTMYATYHMFEGLWEQDIKHSGPISEIIPALATHWEISDDGLEYTFHLREGVKFHDGTPFDADAVKWNYDRFWNEDAPHFYPTAKAYLGYYTRWVKNVEVIDPMTVKITLTTPNYEFLRLGVLSCGQPRMVSPTAVEKLGNDGFVRNPVGTGPFKFAEIEPNVKTILVRNDDYWGPKPKLDSILFRPLEDPATRVNALEVGEVHIIDEPPFDLIEEMQERGFVLAINPATVSHYFITLNMKSPKLQDVRVRKAINMAIDRETISRDVNLGASKPAWGMLSEGTYAFDPDFVSYPYDPEGAKKLLAEAGAEGIELEFDIFQYGYGEVWEKQIQRDLKKVGIKLNLNKIEWQAYLNKWLAGMPEDIDMNEMGWGMATPYWTGFHTRCDHRPPNGFNGGWYCNEEVDALLNRALAEPDEAAAAALYREANRIIMMEDVAYAPMFHYFRPVLHHPKVKGFHHAPEWWYDLTGVSLEE